MATQANSTKMEYESSNMWFMYNHIILTRMCGTPHSE